MEVFRGRAISPSTYGEGTVWVVDKGTQPAPAVRDGGHVPLEARRGRDRSRHRPVQRSAGDRDRFHRPHPGDRLRQQPGSGLRGQERSRHHDRGPTRPRHRAARPPSPSRPTSRARPSIARWTEGPTRRARALSPTRIGRGIAHLLRLCDGLPSGSMGTRPNTRGRRSTRTPPTASITAKPTSPTGSRLHPSAFSSNEGGSTFLARPGLRHVPWRVASPRHASSLASCAHVFHVKAYRPGRQREQRRLVLLG